MRHYDIIKFFNSIKDNSYNESIVSKKLSDFEPLMTHKKLSRLIAALNKYILKEETKIKSKYFTI